MTMTDARPTATGAPGYTETMPCEPESARRARLLVSAALSAWGIGELAGVGVQIVAELVNNAIDHTRCRVVRVLVRRGRLRVWCASVSPTAAGTFPRWVTPTTTPRTGVACSWSSPELEMGVRPEALGQGRLGRAAGAAPVLRHQVSLRLMHADELVDDPSPEACVELVFGPCTSGWRVRRGDLRQAPADDSGGPPPTAHGVRVWCSGRSARSASGRRSRGSSASAVGTAKAASRSSPANRTSALLQRVLEGLRPVSFWCPALTSSRQPRAPALGAPKFLRCHAGEQVKPSHHRTCRQERKTVFNHMDRFPTGSPLPQGHLTAVPVGSASHRPVPARRGPRYTTVSWTRRPRPPGTSTLPGCPTMSPGHGTSSGTNPVDRHHGPGRPQQRLPGQRHGERHRPVTW